ncbi:MAG: DnaA ATPase domain-containing protein, partial [Pirellulaceae bacterium]
MTRSFTEIQSAIAWQLKESIGEDRFELWFGSEDAFSIQDGQVQVTALDELSLSFVQSQFGTFVNEAVRAVLGPGTRVQFDGCQATNEPATQQSLFTDEQLGHAGVGSKQQAKQKEKSSRTRRKPDNSLQTPTLFTSSPSTPAAAPHILTLESFVFGSGNQLLETAVQQTLAQPGKFTPLYLHGPVGCGKSHLLQGMIARARRDNLYHRCVNVTSEQFTSGFVEALQSRTLTGFRNRYRNLDLLLVDDVQFLTGKEATIIEFQNTLECLLKSGRQVVVTADRPVFQLNIAHEQLLTRLASGLACPISWPDIEARNTIVQRLADSRQLELPADVQQLLSQRIGRDVRLLIGAINRLKTAAVALGNPINVTSATELLADLFHAQHPVVSLSRVEEVVCDHCGVE